VRLTLLLTTPRLPAGQLTGPAWRAIFSADAVLTADVATGLAQAVAAAGCEVEVLADPTATRLLSRAAIADLVWLAADDGDEVILTIESWARSGDRLSRFLYQKLRMAKEVQFHMWTSFLESGAKLAGGRLTGGIDVETRVVEVPTGAG